MKSELTKSSILVFYSYALNKRDEALRKELEKHLSLMHHQGLISEWHQQNVVAGGDIGSETVVYLNKAQIILLLISADFIASEYCYGVEMSRAMERHEAKEAHVIPIILRPVDWQGAPFANLKSLPTDGKAVTEWTNRDRAFTDIAMGIRKTVEALLNSTHATSEPTDYLSQEQIKINSLSPHKDTETMDILPPKEEKPENIVSFERRSHLAQFGIALNTALFIIAIMTVFSILFGATPLPQFVSLREVIHSYPTETIILGSILAGISITSQIIAFRLNLIDNKFVWHIPRHFLSITAYALNSLLCVALLTTVIVWPIPCSSAGCSSSLTTTSSGSIHDANLDLYFIALQSPFFVVPHHTHASSTFNFPDNGDPSSIGAINLNNQATFSPYRLVLGIHSRIQQKQRKNILIEDVSLVLDSLPIVPHPLTVMKSGSNIDYHTNPFLIALRDFSGKVYPASYDSPQPIHVELKPNEPDQLDIQVNTRQLVDMRFHLVVTYHLAGESFLHILSFPHIFEVVFSDNQNWHMFF